MEFIEGQTLDQLVQQQKTPEIQNLMRQIDQQQFIQFIEYYQNQNDLLQTYQSFIRLKFRELMVQSPKQIPSVFSPQSVHDELSEDSFLILYKNQPFSTQNMKKFTWEAILSSIFVQLCEVLIFLDQNQIVHRDLKPQNILIQFNGTKFDVKLIDFGLSVNNNTKVARTEMVGTPGYIAPEMYFINLAQNNAEKYTKQQILTMVKNIQPHKADMWALGSILFYMVACYHPFIPTRSEKYESLQLKYGLYLPLDLCGWEDVPVYFRSTLKKLMQTKAEMRPSAVEILSFFKAEKETYENRRKIIVTNNSNIKPVSADELKKIVQKTPNAKVPIMRLKIVLVGDFGMGKSKMTQKMSHNSQTRIININNQLILLGFADTQGTESRRNSMLKEVLENVDVCFLCCFKERNSMRDVEKWRELVEESAHNQYNKQKIYFTVLFFKRRISLLEQKIQEEYEIIDESIVKNEEIIRQKYECFEAEDDVEEILVSTIERCLEGERVPIVLVPAGMVQGGLGK